MLSEEEIMDILKPLIEAYARERQEREHFGDFVIRKGIVKPAQRQ
jgi:sulfite reductase (NADPH) hemoprotein beta-component